MNSLRSLQSIDIIKGSLHSLANNISLVTEEQIARKRQTDREWKQRNRARCAANARARSAANPERAKEIARQSYERTREMRHLKYIAERERRIAYQMAWKAANPDKAAEQSRLWTRRHPERANANKAKRLAAQQRAIPRWANLDEIAAVYKDSVRRTKTTGIQHHVDHIVPLVSKWVCGLHCPANLEVITWHENRAKSNRHWPDMPECLKPRKP